MDNSTLVRENSSLIPTITECHANRLGWPRTLLGGFSMYLSIPFWVICHVTLATFCYQWIMRPILGIKRLRWADYVILDRHRIDGLVAIDKFNCLFCGYANGITTLINHELDQLNQLEKQTSMMKRIAGTVAAILFLPFIVIGDIFCVRFNYDMIIAPLLGMHTTSFAEIQLQLHANQWGKNFNPLAKYLFVYAKNVFTRVALLLEQIESSWCPLYHLENRTDVVYPEHHQHFFKADELDKMRQVLSSKGSVSPRQPENVKPFAKPTGWLFWD